jgi:hypothetical protein
VASLGAEGFACRRVADATIGTFGNSTSLTCRSVVLQYWGPKWAQKPGTPDKVVFSKIVDIEALARAENPVNHEARKYYNLMKWLKQQPGSNDALNRLRQVLASRHC